MIVICATLGQHLLLSHVCIDATTVPAASETRLTRCHRDRSCLRGQGLCYLSGSLQTDPRVQLLKVFKNSIGNSWIPHPVRANSERKEILRSVICFRFFWCVLYVRLFFCFQVAFPF